MSNVIPLPTALTRRSDRVDAVCDAVAHGKAVRPLVDAEEVDGTVRITVGDLELGVDPAEALTIANRIATAAGAAIACRRGNR